MKVNKIKRIENESRFKLKGNGKGIKKRIKKLIIFKF